MSEGSDSTSLLMASLFSAKMLVECGANIVSDVDREASWFGERSLYCSFRVHSLHVVKNLTSLWASRVRKRIRSFKSKRAMLLL
jgi:hypothetical protein